MTKHISHTCARRSCRPARYLSSSTDSHTSKRCLATALRVSSSITTGHYARGSKASGFQKQYHEGSTTSSQVETPLVYSCCSTCSSKKYLYFSWNVCFTFVGDPSSSFGSWLKFRSRSTRRSIHMNEPKVKLNKGRTIGIICQVESCCKATYGSCFYTPPSLLGTLQNFKPRYSTVSLGWIQEYLDNTFA